MIKLRLIVRRFKSRHFRRQCENTGSYFDTILILDVLYFGANTKEQYIKHKIAFIHVVRRIQLMRYCVTLYVTEGQSSTNKGIKS